MKSAVALIPIRPEMPINGLSREDWAVKYRRQLSDYYRWSFGHYPDDTEWLILVDLQYDYQRHRDGALHMMETEV